MHEVYVCKDERGYYCPPLVNNDCRTQFLGLATQWRDLWAAKTIAETRGMMVCLLQPVALSLN
jgi:hypothetical protein